MKCEVNLIPSSEKIQLEFDSEESELSLLEILKENGHYVKSTCGGHASCSDCIVKIRSGSDQISEPTFEEIKLLGNVFHITKERLSCQVKVRGDVSVDISGHNKGLDQESLRHKTAAVHKKTVLRRSAKEKEQIIEERIEKAKEKRAQKEAEGPKESGFYRPKDPFRSNEERSKENSKSSDRQKKKF